MSPDVILIGCTKLKRAERAAARDLYDPSDLFRRRRRYAEASGVPWAVLSARHGVIEPGWEIEPYDFTIRQRLAADWKPGLWAHGVLAKCFLLAGRQAVKLPDAQYARFVEPLTIEIHAGIDYVRAVELAVDHFVADITIVHPVAGMGIGEQKAWYFGHQLTLQGVGS